MGYFLYYLLGGLITALIGINISRYFFQDPLDNWTSQDIWLSVIFGFLLWPAGACILVLVCFVLLIDVTAKLLPAAHSTKYKDRLSDLWDFMIKER